jgi:putative ABC transport system substrate-binding protein
VDARVDVIAAAGNPPAHAAKNVTSTIPIVMLYVGSPVEEGLVPSLARPTGNLTGTSVNAGQGQDGKRMQLLHTLAPQISRVAVLWNPNEPGLRHNVAEALDAAIELGIPAHIVEARAPGELAPAFRAIQRHRAEAVFLVGGPLFVDQRTRLADFALEYRLPAVAARSDLVKAGLLASYGPSFGAMARRGAYYVDRILKGTKPGDLPVEQPMTFDFVVNMKTARELGITFPNEIMLQVTEVIQ